MADGVVVVLGMTVVGDSVVVVVVVGGGGGKSFKGKYCIAVLL